MDIFTTIFLLGLILALFMFVISFAGDLDLFGGDLDVDMDGDLDLDMDTDLDVDGSDHTVGFSYLSPGVIAFLLMGFGAGGSFLEESTDVAYHFVLVGAAVIGLITMFIMRKVFRAIFVDTQFNSTLKNDDFVGAVGLVSLRIPKNDIGEVLVSTKMGSIRVPARANEYISEGSKVKVVDKIGSTIMVTVMTKTGETVEQQKTESEAEIDQNPTKITNQKENETKEENKKDTDFTFDAYKKKEESRKPTVIYDQRNITITDSVITRSDFSELGTNGQEDPSPGPLKDSLKKELKKEVFEKEKN